MEDCELGRNKIEFKRSGAIEIGFNRAGGTAVERGFTLIEIMITLVVFSVIAGSIAALVGKSQSIFRAEQGVSEMDQNARLMMDFLTRDIQQARENAAGLGNGFRPIYSSNGPDGKTDQIAIISADTTSNIPSSALPLYPASTRPFSANDHYVEILPNGYGNSNSAQVAASITPDEQLMFSATRRDGSIQYDVVKAKAASVTVTGNIGLSFEAIQPQGLQSEVPFGSTYNGSFSLRPIVVKNYFVDRTTDPTHPVFSLATDGGVPIPIARNIVAFQLRYLELRDGDVQGNWVKNQTVATGYKTQAVEVTLTARTELSGDRSAERLVTLASVIRPRFQPTSGNGPNNGPPWGNPNGLPGGGGGGLAGNGGGGSGDGIGITTLGGGGNGVFGGGSGAGGSGGAGSGGAGGWNYRSRQIGKDPKLGESLNGDLDPNLNNQQP